MKANIVLSFFHLKRSRIRPSLSTPSLNIFHSFYSKCSCGVMSCRFAPTTTLFSYSYLQWTLLSPSTYDPLFCWLISSLSQCSLAYSHDTSLDSQPSLVCPQIIARLVELNNAFLRELRVFKCFLGHDREWSGRKNTNSNEIKRHNTEQKKKGDWK